MISSAYLRMESIEGERTCAATTADRRFTQYDHRSRRHGSWRRAQSLAAHTLLRALVERETGHSLSSSDITPTESGKPMIDARHGAGGIEVALSHSGMIAACAISDLGPIGIDVEYCAERSIHEIAPSVFGPRERRAVASGGPSAFYRIWTLREALAKASGARFSILDSEHDFFANAPRTGIWRTVIEQQGWLFSTGAFPGGYAYAIAAAVAPHVPLPANCDAALAALEFKARLPHTDSAY